MGDTSRHLTYFKVENFKRFESFEMKDLGQFNLIVGDNNVGKTSVLESLLIDDHAIERAINFFYLLRIKNYSSNLKYRDLELFINRTKPEGNNNVIFHLDRANQKRKIEWIFNWRSQEISIIDELDKVKQSVGFAALGDISEMGIPFVSPFYRGNESANIANFYSENVQVNPILRREFINAIRILVPKIVDIEPFVPQGREPSLLFKFVDTTTPLFLHGDGTINLFRILIGIFNNNGGRLMLDEVDAGIHYSRLKDFWKVILMTAKENNVQLFMTTHSEECIKYFKEVLEENSKLKNLARSITLVENRQTKQVTAHTYSFEELEHAVNVGNEIRA